MRVLFLGREFLHSLGTFQPARARLSTSALGALPRLSGANPLLCDVSTSAQIQLWILPYSPRKQPFKKQS